MFHDILQIASTWATKYSSLINLCLTAFLVFLTGWYAFVTRRMWREMVESRLSRIRPILHVRVRDLVLIEERERNIGSDVSVHNFGSGPAYAVRAKASLRYESTEDKTWIDTELELPPGLAPGQDHKVTFNIGAFPTSMNESRKEFLEVLFLYQDSESNYYCLRQVYDLRVVGPESSVTRTWQLRSEELKFKRLGRKREIWDFRQAYPDHDMETIMEYRLDGAWDWSSRVGKSPC